MTVYRGAPRQAWRGNRPPRIAGGQVAPGGPSMERSDGSQALGDSLSPSLRSRMQGKSCFNFTTVDPQQLKELAVITRKGIAGFKDLKLPWA